MLSNYLFTVNYSIVNFPIHIEFLFHSTQTFIVVALLIIVWICCVLRKCHNLFAFHSVLAQFHLGVQLRRMGNNIAHTPHGAVLITRFWNRFLCFVCVLCVLFCH